MGTNFYVAKDYCSVCGRSEKKHIGKRSGGWQFMFRAEPGIMSAEDWRRETEHAFIEDENGTPYTYKSFWREVDDSRSSLRNHYDYCVERGILDHNSFKDEEGWSMTIGEFS